MITKGKMLGILGIILGLTSLAAHVLNECAAIPRQYLYGGLILSGFVSFVVFTWNIARKAGAENEDCD
jgi:hypothetical protein